MEGSNEGRNTKDGTRRNDRKKERGGGGRKVGRDYRRVSEEVKLRNEVKEGKEVQNGRKRWGVVTDASATIKDGRKCNERKEV
jgi:hypothetical protein